MASVTDNLARVKEAISAAAIRAGRDPGSVILVAVSKRKSPAMVREAIAAGQLDFGENYAQELRDKMREIADPRVRWHFIGSLQKNKVKYVAGKAYEVHTVDGLELAREIGARAEREGTRARVMIEVNVGGEASKSGVDPEAAAGLVEAVRGIAGVELVGLMTMPPFEEDPARERPYYRALRELRDRIRTEIGEPAALPELSMGLSHDFTEAIAEGATRVRIGTAIFGARE
ncbi:MAG TPA: YggS family pyridoxal phosphate-dependent enzyme [bacterium]|nr:YggS family pyridoxal phosphate-dependent enzyme [bacterium]